MRPCKVMIDLHTKTGPEIGNDDTTIHTRKAMKRYEKL